jgi:glycosyltransferase involved in cell wall biosynthesis
VSHNLHQFFDVSVLCSSSEGFPNSLIEAMAAGRPVVATPVGGVTDVVVDRATGILVPLDDTAPCADALRMLEADPKERARLAGAGLAAVRQRFHQDIVIEELSGLYETLAKRRSSPTVRSI